MARVAEKGREAKEPVVVSSFLEHGVHCRGHQLILGPMDRFKTFVNRHRANVDDVSNILLADRQG